MVSPWAFSAEVYEVNENEADGNSHVLPDGTSAEDALGLNEPYSLEVAYTDKKPTCKGTWMTKFKLKWHDTEVWNFSVVLEKQEKSWTQFATGYLVAGKFINCFAQYV